MESLNSAELIELVLLANESLDAQFEYWLSVSIAGIVATFIGGEHLHRKMRVVLVILYLLSSMLFLMKYLSVAGWILSLGELQFEVAEPVLNTPLSPYIFVTRSILFSGGVMATVWFILTARKPGSDA